MPNGDLNGGIQGIQPDTYPLSVWFYEHEAALKEVRALVLAHWDPRGGTQPSYRNKAGEALWQWVHQKHPEMRRVLEAKWPDFRWENIDWGELARYVVMTGAWNDETAPIPFSRSLGRGKTI